MVLGQVPFYNFIPYFQIDSLSSEEDPARQASSSPHVAEENGDERWA
jgi:hypothetical protein